MPIYNYKCPVCKKEYESFEKMGNQYKVPMLSYVFDTQDLNEILQIARGKAHE